MSATKAIAHLMSPSSKDAVSLLDGEKRPRVPLLGYDQRLHVEADLLNPIENRKSGLSLNHIIGCSLDCAYCVRHLFGNFQMKRPHAIMEDEAAVDLLVSHPFFQRHLTPLQIFNRATDPFLPEVKSHTFQVLRLLAERGLRNHVLVITRFALNDRDAATLNDFSPLRITLLVTYSGIDDTRIEPLGWRTAINTLEKAFNAARSYRTILYWRPIVVGLNDSAEHVQRALSFSKFAHATVFTGLFYRDSMRQHYLNEALPEPYQETARRKIFPRDLEKRILTAFKGATAGSLFRKTSCAVAYAHGESDYNGHYGIKEVCDICPMEQFARCAAKFRRPSAEDVSRLAIHVGTDQVPEIGKRAIVFDALDEQRRYFIQHSLGFQVHDRRHPHYDGRHGRAETGWEVYSDGD